MSLTIRFPAALFQYYGSPLALWLYARGQDSAGSGRAEFDLGEAAEILNRSKSCLRRWLKEGYDQGVFRYFKTRCDRVTIYYSSLFVLAARAGMEQLGAIAWAQVGDLPPEKLRYIATEAIAIGLQRESWHAAKMLGCNPHPCDPDGPLDKAFVRRKAKKLRDRGLLVSPDKFWATRGEGANRTSRSPGGVLYDAGRFTCVSEKFVCYGGSQKTIAARRGLSSRTIQRHLAATRAPSPIRGYRADLPTVDKTQLAQRISGGGRVMQGLLACGEQWAIDEIQMRKMLRIGNRAYIAKCNLYDSAVEISRCRQLRRTYKFKLNLRKNRAAGYQVSVKAESGVGGPLH
ncbi:MAG: hypothetical protein F6J93_02950 [Oscillatoria sp. SIO1A7]|nr:hypothetical protein [Oscillatoria sp. SIO1A7]